MIPSQTAGAFSMFGGKKPFLGLPVVPIYPFFGEGSPTKIDYRKKVGTLILTSLLESNPLKSHEPKIMGLGRREGRGSPNKPLLSP